MPHGLHPVLLFIEEAWIIILETDKPDPVGDFPDADILACQHRARVDLAVANANLSALGDMGGPAMKRIFRNLRVVVFAC